MNKKMSMIIRNLFASVIAMLVSIAGSAQAQLTWDANGTGTGQSNGAGAWLGVNLWWNGTANQNWVSGSDAIFAGTATAAGAVTLASPTTVNSLTFSPSFTGTYTLGTAGQAITNNNGITKNASSGLVTIVSPITLGGSQTWTNNSANKLQISSFVATAGFTLTLAGTGEFNFPTTTTGITGGGSIIVDGAYLNTISGGNQANNTYTGTTTVQNGGQISYYANNIGTGNINLNGGILNGYYNEGFTRPYGAGSGQFQITGGVSGFGVNGGNTINFNNVTSVKWGDATFNPSKFVLGGGVYGGTVTFAENIDLNNADRTVTTPVGGVLSGALSTSSGTAGLIKEGTGTLALSTSNTYNGGTTISAGTLSFGTRLSMPIAGTVTVANGGTLGVTVAGSATTWGGGTGVAGIAGLTSTANSGEGYGSQTGALVNFDGNSFLNLNVTANVTEANAIGNGSATSISLIKSGTSMLTLTGNNTYSGGTTLSAGTLAVGSSTTALSSGTLYLNAGTIQSSDNTARTISNAVSIGGDFTVGGTGDLTFSNTGASALGWTRKITVNPGRNATFAQAFSGSGYGITKDGNGTTTGTGTLTLTGNNTFTGTTTINSGKIVLNNDGDVTSSTVVLNGSNTGLTITGGSGVTSIWNNNGGDFSAGDFTNVQVVIDGAGTAGSARVTNVAKLVWGRSATSSTILLTNGGQMNVTGEIQIGSSYYMNAGETGDANLTIGGGTATSTFTGNNQTFYIGLGDRNGSNNNDVNVNSGGVLTGIGAMVVGHLNYGQDKDDSRLNKLTVDGTGIASMGGVTVGYANVAGPDAATANVVQVTNGGTLSTSGANYIGKANVASSIANANTATVSGTGSRWNAGNQAVYVGYTGHATAVSTGNVLTVSAGGVVTNISTLTVKAANTLSLGVGGTIYANAVTHPGTLAVALDGSATPACGCLNVSGNLNLNNATLNVTVGANPIAPCVIATYGSLTGAFSVTNLPANYSLDTHYNDSNQIAVKFMAAGTLIQFF